MVQKIPSHSPWLAWSMAVARPVRCAESPQGTDGTTIECPLDTGGTGFPAVVPTAHHTTESTRRATVQRDARWIRPRHISSLFSKDLDMSLALRIFGVWW